MRFVRWHKPDQNWYKLKGAFVLGENDFRKSFSPKPRRLAATVNFIFWKMASCWPKFSPLTWKWFYTLIFTSNHFRKKRERERRESPDRRAPIVDCAARRSTNGAIVWRAHLSIDERHDRWAVRSTNECTHRLRSSIIAAHCGRLQSTAWSRLTAATIDERCDRAVDRDLAKIEIAPSSPSSGFVFSFFFSKHQKIFFRNFFEMQPNTWKHFPFRKIAFPENGIFSGNAFTRTKHNLKC